ncbi:type VI secretion system protein ImpK [Massilia sp. Root351]|uniref:DotU family type IV/VI secretion system protein n=1 Tax=Massilia sp. Root351 TaxID=1736522 RepID=UPI00070AFE6C|nr:DotU family type IV/VI secretion system protein [Massilia sp. Root351]KQV85038.1 type VI secretion system protein ImpK [Massilia sp. Root351]
MSAQIERRAAPSLLGNRAGPAAGPRIASLLDLMHEGFYVLFMLKNGSAPPGEQEFAEKVLTFLAGFENEARRLRAHGTDIEAAKYAYCAALDETILASGFPIRGPWERRPLQLRVFGDQLAGEHFFDRLEDLRAKGGVRLQALQVFHLCLLLGFKGKYALDSSDKLACLTARLGDEISHIKGRSRGFAPRAERPDQVAHKLRSDVPLWTLAAVFSLAALGVYAGMKASLEHATRQGMADYAGLVKLAPRQASLTITLP